MPMDPELLADVGALALRAHHQTLHAAASRQPVPAHLHVEIEQAPTVQTLPADVATESPKVDLAALKVDLLSHLRARTTADSILLGVDAFGNEVRGDIHTMMHTLSGGTTGGGKTTLLASLGLQMAYDPDVAIAIADPHLQELALLEDTGAVMYPLPMNTAQATAILAEIANEVRRRAELIAAASEQLKALHGRRVVLNRIDKFNAVCHQLGLEPLYSIVTFGDELRGLVGDSKEGAKAIDIITSEGRKFGIYFIGSSQSWKANVIDTATKSMFWTRYLMPGLSLQQSASILEMEQKSARPIVEQLTAPGVCALWRRGQQVQVVKTPFIDLESSTTQDAIERAATARSATCSAIPSRSASELFNGSVSSTAGATSVASDVHNGDNEPGYRFGVAVTQEERERIIAALLTVQGEGGNVSKREVCRRTFGQEGGQAFKKVSAVMDELENIGKKRGNECD
jgi:hypothetical protein